MAQKFYPMNGKFSSRQAEFLARWGYFCSESRPDLPMRRSDARKPSVPKPPPKRALAARRERASS